MCSEFDIYCNFYVMCSHFHALETFRLQSLYDKNLYSCVKCPHLAHESTSLMKNVFTYQFSDLSVQFPGRQDVPRESSTQLDALYTDTVENILSRAVRLKEGQLMLDQYHQALLDL